MAGFWTRLVGPFKQPVDPVLDGVPDYLEKVKRPMDLNTVRDKMQRHEYADENEFVEDIRQIFQNAHIYWSEGDQFYSAATKLQKTFEEKYGEMNKWLGRMTDEGEEAI